MFDLRLWKEVLTKPKETFKKERKNASLGNAAKNFFVASIISALMVLVSSYTNPEMSVLPEFWEYMIVLLIPISVLASFAMSGIYYVIARLLDGKGNYATQTWLMSVYTVPITLISSLITLIPYVDLLSIFVGLYSLYLLTLSFKETHKFNTGRAIMTWIIPFMLIIVVAAIIASFAVSYFMSSLSLEELANLTTSI
ncbi:MAG: YIP1 family protein [Candidatus Aenigmarchaeota archaeon]|nr:YIP1 family protein [Candidatus Aenigmarchaeota archaeon]